MSAETSEKTVAVEWPTGGSGVARVAISRPQALNALNRQVLDELAAALSALEEDVRVRVIVVTGAGRAFVAGADIGEIAALSSGASAEAFSRAGQSVFSRLASSRLVSIMAINGYALGGGLELALAGDLRLMAESANVGLPEIGLGIIPGFGGTQRLGRLVGEGRALELVLTGRQVAAAEALRLGLANQVVPDAELSATADAWAAELAAKAPQALVAAKRAVRGGWDRELADGLAWEAQCFGGVAATADAREGTDAFLHKRPPHFTGH